MIFNLELHSSIDEFDIFLLNIQVMRPLYILIVNNNVMHPGQVTTIDLTIQYIQEDSRILHNYYVIHDSNNEFVTYGRIDTDPTQIPNLALTNPGEYKLSLTRDSCSLSSPASIIVKPVPEVTEIRPKVINADESQDIILTSSYFPPDIRVKVVDYVIPEADTSVNYLFNELTIKLPDSSVKLFEDNAVEILFSLNTGKDWINSGVYLIKRIAQSHLYY
jgi:hypothetical protein